MRLWQKIACLALITMGLMQPVWAKSPYKTIVIEKKHKALLYLPKSFKKERRYPVIMALHGMGEKTTYTMDKWRRVADRLNMILISPVGSNFKQGYTRTPVDDRVIFTRFQAYLDRRYNIDTSRSILAGFSRGGNFAIETGLLYPGKFPNVICIFGFYNMGINTKAIASQKRQSTYKRSRFYLMTGKDDLTEKSLNAGYTHLKKNKIKATLKTYPKLKHQYPPNLSGEIKEIMKWMR